MSAAEDGFACPQRLPAATGGLRSPFTHDSQEAELGAAQGRARPAHQRMEVTTYIPGEATTCRSTRWS